MLNYRLVPYLILVITIAFLLLIGGFIVYMEIDKRKFIDSVSSVAPVVGQPVNVLETTREVTQASEEPKFQEVSPDELLAAVNRVPEQFGYTEAATTYAKLEGKKMSGERLTPGEKVARLEAMLYLWPNEYTRRSLILEKWKQSKGPSYGGYSDEDIAELKELGISVVWRDNMMIISTAPDHIRKEIVKELREKYAHILVDPKYFPPSPPVSESISSESIGEATDFPQKRSEVSPVMSEPKIPVTTDHVHHEDRHVHESPTLQPPTPAAAKGVEANGWKGLSPEQRDQAKQFSDQYGTEEGLRRFREMDPEAAAQFEREQRKPPVPSEPNDAAPSTR